MMFRISQIVLVGLTCATMLTVGLGFVFPVSSAVGALCDILLSRRASFLSGCSTANDFDGLIARDGFPSALRPAHLVQAPYPKARPFSAAVLV